MKRTIRKLIALPLLALLVCSCGEDRSGEYYELTQENQWIYYKMKEVYLWADAIGEIKQNIFFSTPSQFFKKLLYTDDKTSFFTDTLATTSYGITTSLMRDPLGITPSKTYALIEFVEPGSVAETAGLERGMWISEIDGIIKRLRSYGDKTLRSEIENNQEEMLKLVNRYFHCG